MPTIHIHGQQYDVPEAVADCMKMLRDERDANYNACLGLKGEIEWIKDCIRQLRIKETTARHHPTKYTRLEAYKAKKELYSVVAEVEQGELMLK